MAHSTITVRLSGVLRDVAAANVGETGSYENVSEYLRDLIRRDQERTNQQTFEQFDSTDYFL